jgi:CheY-like chemotaxis protein
MIKSILLVDDDPDDVSFFQEALLEVDSLIYFLSAKTGIRALELLSQPMGKRPDLIFLDINMPEMSGWNCLSEIKKHPALQNIPVVMYSTSARKSDSEKAISLGALGLYQKPEKFDDLKRLIVQFLTAA